jgi:hypothetical protein
MAGIYGQTPRIVERIPVGPGHDLVEMFRAWTLGIADLTVPQKLVVRQYGVAFHTALYQGHRCG